MNVLKYNAYNFGNELFSNWERKQEKKCQFKNFMDMDLKR